MFLDKMLSVQDYLMESLSLLALTRVALRRGGEQKKIDDFKRETSPKRENQRKHTPKEKPPR